MINKHVDQAVFDTILAKAFKDAAQADRDSEENDENAVPVAFSAQQSKIQKRAYKKHVAHSSRIYNHKRYATMRKIVACVLIVCAVGFVTVFAIPPVRAAVVSAVVEFFDKYMTFDFGSNKPSENSAVKIGDYTAYYIPDGFVLTDVEERRLYSKYTFENSQSGKSFFIKYSVLNDVEVQYDHENGEYSETSINGFVAYLVRLADDSTELIFSDDINTIVISGKIDKNNIIKIGNNLR